MSEKIQFLAYYLPQYHQIPENDEWWGEGFTEWTNVKKAKPLFKGHQQPVIPGELGYYDLLKTEGIQEKQAALAKKYGIDGFIYYQYWFGGGKMLLEKPAEKMLANKKVDIPFCFCWANETWSGIWHGAADKVLIEQKYLGEEDYKRYFEYLLPFFNDERYIKVDNMPMFHIYAIYHIPDYQKFLTVFNVMARENGFDGIYFIGSGNLGPEIIENDEIKGVVGLELFSRLRNSQLMYFNEQSRLSVYERWFKKRMGLLTPLAQRKRPIVLNYKKGIRKLSVNIPHNKYILSVIPNWDNSPRSKNQSLILNKSSPEIFGKFLGKSIDAVNEQDDVLNKIIVIKSWNEWAEGNYLEPDSKHGLAWLEQLQMVKEEQTKL